jgi:hypothetical protein
LVLLQLPVHHDGRLFLHFLAFRVGDTTNKAQKES